MLTVAVTVLGTVEDGGPPPVSRAGAQPGDVLLVTGPCGGSAAGLRILRAGAGGGRVRGGHRIDGRPTGALWRGSGRAVWRGPPAPTP